MHTTTISDSVNTYPGVTEITVATDSNDECVTIQFKKENARATMIYYMTAKEAQSVEYLAEVFADEQVRVFRVVVELTGRLFRD